MIKFNDYTFYWLCQAQIIIIFIIIFQGEIVSKK